MSVKFVCTTQKSRMQGFTGPSGFKYVSILGRAFDVPNKDDQEYFDANPRFIRHNLANKVAGKIPSEKLPEEEELFNWCVEKAGISKAAAERIAQRYGNFDALKDHVVDGDDLVSHNTLTERQADMVRKALYDGDDE